MKAKTKFLYSSILIVVLSACLIFAGMGFTSSWLTDSASANATIRIGKQVAISLSANNIGSKTVAPGESVNFDTVTVTADDDTSTCFVRIKVELDSLDEDRNLFDISQVQIEGYYDENDSSNSYYWVQDGDYFYLASQAFLDGNNLKGVFYGDNKSYNITLKNVKGATTASGVDNSSKSCAITLKVQAIQAANYADSNWDQAFA